MNLNEIVFRVTVLPSDTAAVEEIVSSTGFFHSGEIRVAVELAQEHLKNGTGSGYLFIFAESQGTPVGYVCYGLIPCTLASYDLYWIAVHQKVRQYGIGKQLLKKCEEAVLSRGGKRIYIETSTKEQYTPTRKFYERCGYTTAAVLDDFYAPGDGKVIYLKVL
jgi:ribosomal protein S18 acetylase RimI-like enzyme